MVDKEAGAQLLLVDNLNIYHKTNNKISGFICCGLDLVLMQNWGEDKPSDILFKLDRVGPSTVLSCEKVTMSSDMLYKELECMMVGPRAQDRSNCEEVTPDIHRRINSRGLDSGEFCCEVVYLGSHSAVAYTVHSTVPTFNRAATMVSTQAAIEIDIKNHHDGLTRTVHNLGGTG